MKLAALIYLLITSLVVAGQSSNLGTMPPDILSEIGKRLSPQDIVRIGQIGDKRLDIPSKKISLFNSPVYEFELRPDQTGQIDLTKLQGFFKSLDHHRDLGAEPIHVNLEIDFNDLYESYYFPLSDEYWKEIAARCQYFQTLTLKYAILDDNAARNLAEADFSKLKELVLYVPVEISDFVLQNIGANQTLYGNIALILGHRPKITDNGIRCLTNLTHLELGVTAKITDYGIRDLSNLTYLELCYNNKITDECLKGFPNLKEIFRMGVRYCVG